MSPRPPITIDNCVFIDLETQAVVDLKKTGVHPYAEDPRTDVLCARFVRGRGAVVEEWLRGDPVPKTILEAFTDETVYFSAHNAGFEHALINGVLHPRYGWPATPYERFHCTAAEAAAMSLPRSLEGVGEALGLPVQKDKEGYSLMMRMCKPRRKSGDLPDTGEYHWWVDDPKTGREKLKRLSEYCATDVVVARDVFERLRRLTPGERAVWELDGKINNRGVPIDIPSVAAAKSLVDQALEQANRLIAQWTNGQVPKVTNTGALLEYVQSFGHAVSSVDKKSIRGLLAQPGLDPALRRVLALRTDVGGTAVKKLNAMLTCVSSDNRARGTHLYCGAGTGRWASQRVQFQNVIRDTRKDMDAAITAFAHQDVDIVEIGFGPAIGVISQCLRGMIKAEPGKQLFVCDYSNVEGRGVAYLAGEESKLEAFRLADAKRGPGIYEVAAAGIYGIPVSSVTKDSKERQVGKVAELACIAEGQKVLTDKGLVPIEKVTKRHLLWDGEEFVAHAGVITRGRRETLGYDGIRATEDHIVFTGDTTLPFKEAIRLRRALVGTAIAASSSPPDIRSYVTENALVRSFVGRRLEMTYDILNAGPRNRFTVNGRLVHNCGYGGGAGAFSKMAAAYNVLVTEDQADDIKTAWRESNPRIVQLWRALERAALLAVRCPKELIPARCEDYPAVHPRIAFVRLGGFLYMRLPSGRLLSYPSPKVRKEEVEIAFKDKKTGEKKTKTVIRDVLYCMSANSITHRYEFSSIYSGLLAENLTQAFCRDLLAHAMLRLEAAGYPIVLHVHDEAVAEVPIGFGSMHEFEQIMCELPEWAEGFPLKAEGFVTTRYRK